MVTLTGYTDRWSVRAGEPIAFHVHSAAGGYDAQLVRLIHGDENPAGPGFKEVLIDSPLNGRHRGESRRIAKGSCAVVVLPPELRAGALGWSMAVWVWPTLVDGTHGLLASGDLALTLGADGRARFRAGAAEVVSPVPLERRVWHRIAASLDPEAGTMTLVVERQGWAPGWDRPVIAQHPAAPAVPGTTLVLAALGVAPPRACLNGKLARPRLWQRPLSIAELLAADAVTDGLVAAWDLAREPGTTRIVDQGPHGLDGRTINRPTRAMTGPGFTGSFARFVEAPEEWDAIHFHDDDVGEVGWPASHTLTVPADLPSGVYALRLRDDEGAEDHLPFFVRPAAGAATRPIAFLAPTLSYLAYANESLDVTEGIPLAPRTDMGIRPDIHRWVEANGLSSTYDRHRDGSGICMGSLKRPILDVRPKKRCRTFDAPHQFAADLHLVDWLDAKGIEVDILTDHDLHAEGTAALAPYRVVLTGSHPEYWTEAMLDARDAWLNAGGRLLYLGGNGFYWVTAVAADDPSTIEIRRYHGTRTWDGEPGEQALSLTGEMGGLWRDRGRAPQKTVGVGFRGQGFDRGVPYRRTAASVDPRFAWVFEGVEGEIIGAGKSLVLGHGAAGFEVDAVDERLGTPAHSVVLASSLPLSDCYQFVVEETLATTPWSGGRDEPRLRADIVLLAYPNGGAVFSVGSILWCSTLSADGYGSDTSRITQNVIARFLRDDWR